MKQLYFLDEEEKNRILNLHESATKRQYLSEQAAPSEWLPDPTKNPNWEYQFKDNSWFARKKGTTKEYNISQNKKYARSVNHLNTAYPNGKQTQVKQNTNTDPSKAAQETAKVAQTGVAPAGTTPAGTTPAAGTPAGTTPAGTTPAGTTPAGTSGVVTLKVTDAIVAPQAGTTSATTATKSATDTAETNMSSSNPVVASNAPDEDNSINPNATPK